MNKPNRKGRRTQAAQLRHRQGNLVPSPAPGAETPLPVRINILEQNFQALANAHTQNARGLQTAFMMTDAHIAVHYRILNDLQKESRRGMEVLYRTVESDIDMERYHQELADVMGAYDFLHGYSAYVDHQIATAVKEEDEHDRQTAPGPLQPLPDFGGDHAQST